MSEDWEGCFSEPFDLPCIETILTDKQTLKSVQKNYIRYFDCLGEVNINKIEVHTMGYIGSDGIIPLLDTNVSLDLNDKFGAISLFGRDWDKCSAFYKHHHEFFKMTSKEFMLIEQGASLNISVLGNNIVWNTTTQRDYRQSRIHCVQFLWFFNDSINLLCSKVDYYWMLKELFPFVKKHLKALRKQLGKLINLPDYVYAHAASSNGNKSSQASYHLIHLHLDMRWLHFMSLLALSNTRCAIEPNNDVSSLTPDDLGSDVVLDELQLLISELIELSIKRFESIDVSLLKHKSPFNCTCVQELWLLIIKVTHKLHIENKGKTFWDYLTLYLDGCVLQRTEECQFLNDLHSYFKNNPSKFSIYSLWILYHISRLHKHIMKDTSSNYSLLESNLKQFFNSDTSEANLRTSLFFIEKISLEVWEPKAEMLLILWEHFHKKINTNFYVRGAPPSTLAFVSKTPIGLINQLKSYLSELSNISDSFQHFLRITGLHLQKVKKIPRHWNLLKGRVYSKLTLAKLETLSNNGEYHFISLFLMLAITQDIKQAGFKMLEIINSYYTKKKYLSVELIKGQLALALLLLENDEDASVALQSVANYVQTVNIYEQQEVMRMYVETFQDILAMNKALSLGQHLLIDKWISDYLSTSSQTDVSRLLDTLVILLKKLRVYCDFGSPEQNITVMIEKLWDQLRNYLECSSSQQETPYQVSEIAASLAAISLQISNRERFIEIVNMFVYRSVTDVSVLRQFICNISQNEEIKNVLPSYDKIILKTWVKCCFLCTDMEHSEMKELTRTVVKLPEMVSLLGEASYSLIFSSEPLLDFFSSLHNKYATEDLWKRQALREKVSAYLEGLEQWIKPIVNPPKDNGRILSLYTTVGSMIRLNSNLLYIKSRPNTLLQLLIDLLLLPMSVRNPEAKIHSHILSAVKASLHLFIEGLLYLDPESDHYISRVLKELLMVYIPHCMNTQNQNALNYGNFVLISHFSNFDNTSRKLLLQTIANIFLKKKSKNPPPSALSALKFIKELINTHRMKEDVLTSIVGVSLERLCDIIMYTEDKSIISNSAKDIVKLILNSQTLRASDNAVEGLLGVLTTLCQEHLAWSSRQLFDLLVMMTSVAPDLIRRFTPILLQQVQHVEAKRGVGYDRTLRLGVERIEISLRAIKDVE